VLSKFLSHALIEYCFRILFDTLEYCLIQKKTAVHYIVAVTKPPTTLIAGYLSKVFVIHSISHLHCYLCSIIRFSSYEFALLQPGPKAEENEVRKFTGGNGSHTMLVRRHREG
jgi:hypothetical protein